MSKSTLEKHGETLKLTDFVKFAKECGMIYLTTATIYHSDGTECKLTLDKSKNKKWKELKKRWNAKN